MLLFISTVNVILMMKVLPFMEGHVPRIKKRSDAEVFPGSVLSETACGVLWILLRGEKKYLIWTIFFISVKDQDKMKSRCHLLNQAASQSLWLGGVVAGPAVRILQPREKSSKMLLLLLLFQKKCHAWRPFFWKQRLICVFQLSKFTSLKLVCYTMIFLSQSHVTLLTDCKCLASQ